MDNMGWDASEFEANTPIMFRTQHQDLEGCYNISNLSSNFHNNQVHQEASTTSEMQNTNLLTSQSFNSFAFNNYMQDFNMAYQQQQQFKINGTQNGRSACSIDSFDCLFSATNSNTETSVEDAACNNIWNNFNYGSADSSCELSESNEFDETLSQSSSDQHINQGKTLESNKANCSKRSNNDQSDYMFKAGANFKLISENSQKSKKPRWEKSPYSSNINFQQPNSSACSCIEESDSEAIAQMKEMIYRAATFRPMNLTLENVEKPKRKNVRISNDPQTVAARERRERISDRIRVLQNMVPGGSKMDTASMLDEAANYLKYLRSQVKALENFGNKVCTMTCPPNTIAFSFNPSFPSLAGFEV